jgi:hypothetical protein
MHRHSYALGLAAALSVLVTGCGSHYMGATSLPHPTMSTAHTAGTGMSMVSGLTGPAGPSSTARMVCGPEIRGDVAQTLRLPSLRSGSATWVDPLYTCTYRTSRGPVIVTVTDARAPLLGRSYFNALRQSLDPARRLVGLAAFGLPAFETANGSVAFLKDGKTLAVDATKLSTESIAGHQSRADVAYAIAADVIGCWSE